MQRCRLACLLLLLAPPAFGQVRLEWKLTPGESFTLERVYRQKQEIEVKGRTLKHETAVTWLNRVDVKEKTGEGWVVDVAIEEVIRKNTDALTPIAFDDKLAERMKGAVFSLTLTSQGEIKKMKGYEEFIKKASGEKKDVDRVVRALFSEEGMRESFEEVFSFLPRGAVDKGKEWKRQTVDPCPPFGSFEARLDYAYTGVRDGLHAIDYAIHTTYRKPSDQPELFRVVKGMLSGDDGKGQYLFDADAGRLVRGEKSMTVRGEVTVEIGGAATTLKFVSENYFKVRLAPR